MNKQANSEINDHINQIINLSQQTNFELQVDKNEFVSMIHDKYKAATSVVKSKIVNSILIQDNIHYLIKHLIIDNTKSKPILIDKKEFKDPFAPPLHPDMVVSDNFMNLNYHRLIFTKFPLFDNQLLLVTRDFQSQYSHLNYENLRDVMILNYLIDGFCFFNGGQKAGASQPRKHLQAVPYSSLPEKEIGLFKYIKEESNLSQCKLEIDKICKIFSIKALDNVNKTNILIKFDDFLIKEINSIKKIEYTSKVLYLLSKIGLNLIGINDKEEKISTNYSFLLNDNFMLIVLRNENEVYISKKDEEEGKFINLNSLAFFFIIVSRTQEQIDEMKNGNIMKDVLSKL